MAIHQVEEYYIFLEVPKEKEKVKELELMLLDEPDFHYIFDGKYLRVYLILSRTDAEDIEAKILDVISR